jgi:hypothetical protein
LAIEEMLPLADLVIGAVLVHGGRAPHVVTREQLTLMRKHAVLVDVSIDQGGCFETSRPTTHSEPTFEVDEITHYCVTNMPGAVPITSTYALTNATLPYVIELAESGVERALARDPGLRLGLTVRDGEIIHPAMATAFSREPSPLTERPEKSSQTLPNLARQIPDPGDPYGDPDRRPSKLHRWRAGHLRGGHRSGAEPRYGGGDRAGVELERRRRRPRSEGRAGGVRGMVRHHSRAAIAGAFGARRPGGGAR